MRATAHKIGSNYYNHPLQGKYDFSVSTKTSKQEYAKTGKFSYNEQIHRIQTTLRKRLFSFRHFTLLPTGLLTNNYSGVGL